MLLIVCSSTHALPLYSGKYYYANGSYYTSKSGFYYGSSGVYSSDQYRHPYKPDPDYGAPALALGWTWSGWNGRYSGGSIGTFDGGEYYSVYVRTNSYCYYNSTSATSVSTKKWSQTFSNGTVSSVVLPALVTHDTCGWTPKGWTATDKNLFSPSDILYSSIDAQTVSPAASADQIIRAVYSRVKTLSFNGNGATNGTVANNTFTQWFVTGKGVTGTITLPENGFTRTGYAFNGWNTSSLATSGTTAGTIVTPDGAWTSVDAQTYYATWMANKYTVSYDANGGNGAMEDTNTEYDMTIAITNNYFTRNAYVFKGWATESNGDVVYVPGQTVKNLATEDGVTVILYAAWEPLVVPLVESSVANGTTFCGGSYTVTLSCPLEGATIYYTTNGVTPRTSAAFAYTEPIVIYGSANIVAIAVKDGVKSEYTRVSIEQITPDAPVISPADGAEFRSETCEVTISCATDGAEIYYTLDGSEPNKESAIKYTAPFTIADTTTIKSVAVGGPLSSEVIVATLTKRSLTLAEAAGAVDLIFTTDAAAPWQPIVDGSALTGFAAQSGMIGTDSFSWMETTVCGKGTFAFRWRVECEEDDSGKATWDRFVVFTNGVEVSRIDGIKEWYGVMLKFADSGEHTVRWEFIKDDYDEEGSAFSDHGWISGVTWTPDDPLPALDGAATDNDVQAIIAEMSDVRLSDKIGCAAEYATFRNWVDSSELSHTLVKDAPNAWLSYVLDAPGLMAKAAPVASEDVVIESIEPSSITTEAFDLVANIADAEIGEGARLAEALGVEGAAELNESVFSSEGLSVTLERTTDGKAKATVTPVGAPPLFFLRVKVK